MCEVIRLPVNPRPRLVQITREAVHGPVTTALELALENVRKLYEAALAGESVAYDRLKWVSQYETEPEVARLAKILVGSLDRLRVRVVEFPSDCEPEGVA